MTCILTLSNPQIQTDGSYFYQFTFTSRGTDHIALGALFVSLPGYSQTWHWNGSTWLSAGADFIDSIVVGDTYGVILSSGSGFTVPYSGCTGTGGGVCTSLIIPVVRPTITGLTATDIGGGHVRVSWTQSAAWTLFITVDGGTYSNSYPGVSGSNSFDSVSTLTAGSHTICVEAT